MLKTKPLPPPWKKCENFWYLDIGPFSLYTSHENGQKWRAAIDIEGGAKSLKMPFRLYATPQLAAKAALKRLKQELKKLSAQIKDI